MSVPKPARSAIAVTESQAVPRPHVTRGEFWANVIVGGVLVAAVLLGALRNVGDVVIRFIGIDYSTTSTGVAIVEGDHWQSFTLRSKPKGDTLSAYYERIQDLAHDIVAAIDLRLGDVVAIEGIAFAGRGSSVDRLHYAWHRTAEFLTRLQKAELVIVTTNQVKQLATGKGNAQKDEVLLATERRLPQAQASNNDEADAVWIAVGASILAGSPVIDLPAAHMPKAWKEKAA